MRGDGLDGAGAADGDLEAEPVDLPGHRGEHRARRSDGRRRPRRGAAGRSRKKRRVRRMAPSLKLRTARISLPLADQDLGAAAADVDQQQAPVEHGDGLQDAEVDEAGLLDAGDDLDLDAGLVAGPGRGSRRRSRPRARRWWPRRTTVAS